jgi:hypothetical protein
MDKKDMAMSSGNFLFISSDADHRRETLRSARGKRGLRPCEAEVRLQCAFPGLSHPIPPVFKSAGCRKSAALAGLKKGRFPICIAACR